MIYLDNAATTMPLACVIEKAARFNAEEFYNPSALYKGGLENKNQIKQAKDTLLKAFTNGEHDVIFTSCGTESDNQAIFGMAKRGAAVTSEGEHSAVYKCFVELKNRGIETAFAKLHKNGAVDEEDLLSLCSSPKVGFVSIVHVNNETGAINDVNDLAKKIKAINKKIIVHSDGVQAFGKLPFRLGSDVDLYSVSAHKINALKGTGALFIKKGLTIPPLIFGGGQENGLRSGTENIFGVKAFEYAAQEKFTNIKSYYAKVCELKKAFIAKLDDNLFTIISDEKCSPYIVSLAAKGVKGEVIMHMLESFGIVVGNGSACSSKNRYSRVIEACGYKNNDGIVRVSFSPYNEVSEVVYAAEKINECTAKLKGIVEK